MNDQIQNNDTQAQKPAAVLVLDKDGHPVPVQVLGPNEVQDIEYSEDPKGN